MDAPGDAMATDLKRNRSVDADMERVFGAGPALPGSDAAAEGIAAPAVPPQTIDPAEGPPPRRWLLIAAPAIVALFVAVLAIRFALTLVPDRPVPATTDRIRPAVLDGGVPAPAPSAVPSPVVAAPADADAALTPDDFGPAPVEQAPDAPPAPSFTPRAADAQRAQREEARTRRPTVAANGCAPGSNEDRCIFADVLAADRRLRAAWSRATRAGVPNDDLVAIRRRWTRARGISLESPDETIRRYDALATALDDLVETEQR